MPTHLENLDILKNAASQLRSLIQACPNLDLSLDHRLRVFFPRLPEDACTDFLFISQEAPAEPGQSPTITSQQLTALIDECYLTGQVPTFVQGATRVYNYAYTLDDEDLAEGITAPELEKYLEFVTRTPELCVRDALKDFWQVPHQDLNGQTPSHWLSQFTHNLILTEARVRHADITFSPTGMELIEQVFGTGTSPMPPSTPSAYGVYTVTLNGHPEQAATALHGVFVITTKHLPRASTAPHDNHIVQDVTPRPVVLYTPNNGLETYDSLTALSQELSARLKDPYQRERLLDCVLAQERVRAMTHEHVDYTPVADTDVATFYSAQLIDKQQRDMRHAWSVARSLKQDTSFDQLSECVDQSLETSLPLSPANIALNRYTRLVERQLPDWLKEASDEDKTQWRLNVERLNYERLAAVTPDAEPLSEIGQKQTLLGYARLQLKQKIKKDHGINIDPDAIFVSITEAVRTGPLINPISGSGFAAGFSVDRTGPSISFHTTRRSLSELALANVGIWDVTFALTARIKDGAGNTHPVLTTDYVKALVRQLDIGENYKKKLNALLINSKQAHWRKERYVAFKHAQLRLDLLEATLSGVLSADQAAWVKTALDHPVESTRPRLNGEQVKAHLLMMRYKPLPGVLVFSSTASLELLCYTPDAPGKRWFLIANSRNELARMLSQQVWRTYVLRRVTPAQQAYIRPLLEQGLTDSNLQLQAITYNLFEASYDTEALHAIHDADEQSTSTWESNLNTAKETALTAIDIVSFVLPTRVLLPIVLARFIYQVFQGIDALQRDEKHEALLQFMESITHLTDAASDFTGSAIFRNAIRLRIPQPTPSLSSGAVSTPPGASLKVRTGDEFSTGVYESTPTGGGQATHYIKDGRGQLYRSQYDNLDEFWRALDDRKPDATYSTPLRELSTGIWDVDPATPLLKHKSGIERVIERAQVSGVDLTPHTPDEHGIYRVNNMRYIQQGGLVFEVYSGWLGRNWYLQLPSGSSSGASASYKVRRRAGHWEIKHRLVDNIKRWDPLIRDPALLPDDAPAVSYSAYDLPTEHRAKISGLINKLPGFLHPTSTFRSPELDGLKVYFSDFRYKLLADARAHLRALSARPRVTCPAIPAKASLEDIFGRLFEHSRGIVLGETHSHLSGKKILITQLKTLAKQDVKVLYLEHLQSDLHQSLLDDYFKSGKMPIVLDEFLKAQDAGHRLDTSSPYTYSQLVREAKRQGVEVIAIDCMASYNDKGIRLDPQGNEIPSARLARYEMFSYFATQIIRAHQEKIGGSKWVALTGNSHANRFEGIPGVAELEGVIGLRVSDSSPGTSQGLRQNIGVFLPDALNYQFLKNDYWLQVDIQGTKPDLPALTHAQNNDRLKSPGVFRLDSATPQGAQIIHRASNHEIIHTPLQTDPGGQIFIDRESWPTLHLKRYDSLRDLVHDLRGLNMTQVI